MNYLPWLALNCDPPISASWVARIIGVSHWGPADLSFFFFFNVQLSLPLFVPKPFYKTWCVYSEEVLTPDFYHRAGWLNVGPSLVQPPPLPRTNLKTPPSPISGTSVDQQKLGLAFSPEACIQLCFLRTCPSSPVPSVKRQPSFLQVYLKGSVCPI
jgi:hypothetical protein